MTIDVYTEGSYRLHLDFLFEMIMNDNNLTYLFEEKESSIILSVFSNKSEVYKHETNFLDKRRCIESFLINVTEKSLLKN